MAARRTHLQLVVSRTLPLTYGECQPGGANEARPCRFTRCRQHLRSDPWKPRGVGAGRDQRPATETCALDVAARGGANLDEVGELLGGVSRQRVQQLEEKALRKLARIAAPFFEEVRTERVRAVHVMRRDAADEHLDEPEDEEPAHLRRSDFIAGRFGAEGDDERLWVDRVYRAYVQCSGAHVTTEKVSATGSASE